MSRRGNCWDNAVVESFFKTLKVELVYHRRYETRLEAQADIFEYIEVFYNRQRRSVSPFIKVATILIPVQTFESAEQLKVCENLSFTPWHTLEDLRPLGGINRARKKAYEVLSKRRREANGALVVEP